jgi:hypothetical protein
MCGHVSALAAAYAFVSAACAFALAAAGDKARPPASGKNRAEGAPERA